MRQSFIVLLSYFMRLRMLNVEIWPQISTGEKVYFYFPPQVHFSLPFPYG